MFIEQVDDVLKISFKISTKISFKMGNKMMGTKIKCTKLTE